MCSELMTSGESDEGRSYEVSHVIWYDIEDRSSPGWVSWEQSLSDAMEPFQPILSVGIVIWEDEIRLSLTSSAGPEETSGALTIPKSLIISDHRYNICIPRQPAPQ